MNVSFVIPSMVLSRLQMRDEESQPTRISIGKLSVSLAVSVGLLWFVFRSVDFALLVERLTTLQPLMVVGVLLTIAGFQMLRAWRFAYLVRPLAPNHQVALVRIGHLGMFLMMFMPLRLGELARPYLMRRKLGVALSSGLGAAALERTLDGLCVALLFFLGIASLESSIVVPELLENAGWMTLALFGGILLGIVASVGAQPQVTEALSFCLRPLPQSVREKVLTLHRGVMDGFKTLPDFKSASVVIGVTVVIWLMNALVFYLALRAFGWSLGFETGVLLACILVLAIMIPAGPGFLGTYQAALTLGLSLWGVSETDAAAYGLVVYPLTLLVVSSFGAYGYWANRHKSS